MRGALLIASALLWAAPASAQDWRGDGDYGVERMRLAWDRDGVITAESGSVPEHLSWDLGLWVGYADDPLVAFDPADGERFGSIVGRRLGGSLQGSLAILGWFELGVELPLVFDQGGSVDLRGEMGPALSSQGFGDVRLALKVRLLRAARHGIDLALVPSATVPTERGADYLGERSPTVVPQLAASRAFGRTRLAANLGYRARSATGASRLRIDDEILVDLGGAHRFAAGGSRALEVGVALSGSFSAVEPTDSAGSSSLELMAHVAYDLSAPVQVFAGGGAGLDSGYGVPDWRAFFGVRYGAQRRRRDVLPRPILLTSTRAPAVAPASVPAKEPAPEGEPQPPVEEIALEEAAAVSSDAVAPDEEIYFFRKNRARLSRPTRRALAELARTLIEHPEITRVRIEGYTSGEGSERHNLRLSRRRADAVVRFLIERGVDGDRLEPIGLGELDPLDTNHSRTGRARNRRVVVRGAGDSS